MKILCVGGGPAGLYVAILAKLRDPGHDVTVVERNPAGVTYGWGVVFWDDLLDDLYRHDPVSAAEISRRAQLWDGQVVRRRDEPTVFLGGYGYGIGRHTLLDILAERARSLGVRIDFGSELDENLVAYDLIVASDGANSGVRALDRQRFGTDIEVGRNRYIWLGTHKPFNAFTFAFEETSAGWIWFHGYRFDDEMSTCIVECLPGTWMGLRLHERAPEDGVRLLEQVFERHLHGHRLISQGPDSGHARWLGFKRVSNRCWFYGNRVLVGDAAHTTHFAIGSGTSLAIADAIALVDALHRHDELPTALGRYQRERRTATAEMQREADRSAEWFEGMPQHAAMPLTSFAYSLWRRRGAVSSWRYPLHLATQVAPLRRMRAWSTSTRRSLRARRREVASR